MEKYLINGGKPLDGTVKIERAKNAVLPMIAASVMTDDKVVILDCPKIADVLNMIKILNSIGAKTEFSNGNLIIDNSSVNNYEIPDSLAGELRSSVFMMGALLSRLKRIKIAYPGGCDIGKRPIDLHLKNMEKLGAVIKYDDNVIECDGKNVNGERIILDYPSVGATENLMMLGVKSHGVTVIENCAREPEIVDLAEMLNSMGAKIYGAGTSKIYVDGVKKLNGTTYKPMADRIETGTFLLALLMNGGRMQLTDCDMKNICPLIDKFCYNTCNIVLKNDIIYVKSGVVRKSFNITTAPYPFFPTDLQPQATAYACFCEGISVINETVFENRFTHVPELIKMGANITVADNVAVIKGVSRLRGAKVLAKDLRGGASLVLAGLCADDVTCVEDIRHIERGYLDLDKKLASLGADIVKLKV